MKLLIPIAAILIAVLAFGAFLTKPEPQEEAEKPSFPQEQQSQFEGSTFPTIDESKFLGTSAKGFSPDLSKPRYVSLKEAQEFLKDTDEVFMMKQGNQVYVYPLSIMSYHQVINDELDAQLLAVTYSSLSDSGLVLERKSDDTILEFSALNTLYAGNVVLYDKTTASYFSQLIGQAFSGPLKGKRVSPPRYLDRTTWAYAQQDPSIKVLAPVERMSTYVDALEKKQNSSEGLRTLTSQGMTIDTQMDAFTKGFGVVIHNEALFIPFSELKVKSSANIDSGGWRLYAAYNPKNDTYHLWRRYVDGYIHTFYIHEGTLMDKENSSRWNVFGEATEGPLKGKRTANLSHAQVYWYVWAALFPQTFIFK